jgi:regulator of protease activity HflC (stomatin/prohibitin superfamily)
VEEIITTTVVTTTMHLNSQTLTTSDNELAVVSAIIKYSISDARNYLLRIQDRGDVLSDVTAGAVREAISYRSVEELLDETLEKEVLQAVRKKVRAYGFRIESVTFADLGRVPTFRLIHDGLGVDVGE